MRATFMTLLSISLAVMAAPVQPDDAALERRYECQPGNDNCPWQCAGNNPYISCAASLVCSNSCIFDMTLISLSVLASAASAIVTIDLSPAQLTREMVNLSTTLGALRLK